MMVARVFQSVQAGYALARAMCIGQSLCGGRIGLSPCPCSGLSEWFLWASIPGGCVVGWNKQGGLVIQDFANDG